MCTNHRLLLAAFPLLLVLGCSDTTDTNRKSDPVFKSPDEAIMHYFGGIAKNDIRAILQACAINEVSEKFQYDLSAERLDTMSFMETLSPTNYLFYSEMNRVFLSSRILSEVKLFCFSLLSSEKVDGRIISPVDSGRVNRFIGEIDPGRLSNLKIQRICFPLKDWENNAGILELDAERARENGADEATQRLVLFSFEQSYYYVGFRLLRYGQNWKIVDQSCINTSVFGTVQKATIKEFEDKINE